VATRRGHALSAETRVKISKALKGKKHKGHALSSTARAKISAALKGKKHPHAGHALSAATRAKISAALKAHYAATSRPGSRKPRSAGAGGRRAANPRSLANLKRPQRTRPAKYALARGSRTRKFHSGTHRLISSATYHKHTSSIHGIRKRRTRIVIHKRVRHHRVWHRRKRR
jgi:DNA-binding transcriptional ArsR family regulator